MQAQTIKIIFYSFIFTPMSLLPRAEPTFLQKHWRKILLSGAVAAFVVSLFVIAFQARARAMALERLADIQAARNALALYFHYRNDYPPVGESVAERLLGVGNAVCLDRSDEGLRVSCEDRVITQTLPRNVVYSKAAGGDYRLTFTLQQSVGDLGDTDRSGIIDCEAGRDEIRCR